MRIANPSQIRIASTPESSISLSLPSLPSLRDARLGLGRHGRRPRRIGPQARTAEAWSPRHEHRRVVEDAVESAQKRRAPRKELAPPVGPKVACGNRRVRALALASAVDDVEEQLGALPAGHAAPDLVDRKAVRPRERARCAAPASGPDGARQLVAQLAGFDIIRLHAPLAALTRVGLREVGLALMENFP